MEVFSLESGTLIPLGRDPRIGGSKIRVFESNPTNPNTGICDWRSPHGVCDSPNAVDDFGFYTDDYTSGSTGLNTSTTDDFC
jgi:hypothetical protein